MIALKFTHFFSEFSRFGVSANNTSFNGLNELFNNLGLIIRPQHPLPASPQKQQTKVIKRRFENKAIPILSAELIKHLTLKAGTECICDNVQSKKWRMRNNGSTEWGYNTELVFCSGSECMILNKRVSVSNCQPMKCTDISLQIKVPKQNGRYTAYYQLESNGNPFGPRLCIDIISVNKPRTNEIAFDHNIKPKGRRLSMVLSKNIPSITCICGEYLMATKPS